MNNSGALALAAYSKESVYFIWFYVYTLENIINLN